MAKQNSKKDKKEVRKITSLTPLLGLGFILIVVTALLSSLISGFPKGLETILYIVGILALLVYMFQIAFEKRTGRKGGTDEPINHKSSGK